MSVSERKADVVNVVDNEIATGKVATEKVINDIMQLSLETDGLDD